MYRLLHTIERSVIVLLRFKYNTYTKSVTTCEALSILFDYTLQLL